MDASLHFDCLVRLADDHMILGHRLSEWCGHAPMLEEDLALPNIALDLLGQARILYDHAGKIEGKGRNEDQLAYLRLERDYRNLLLCERPIGDFGHTVLRQFYFASFMGLYWSECQNSNDQILREVAAKAIKECAYHIRHTGEWVIRLGDGTDESHQRMQNAVADLAPYVGEMFHMDETSQQGASAGLIPDVSKLAATWHAQVAPVLAEATLETIEVKPILGGRSGQHGEEMGFLLTDLQFMQRTFPNMTW
ncbi:Phenylacetate-CoA oxygenase, PaaI subunit [Rhodobacterales bacterium HTCC2150]|nr:Phenylacetate-CoA oxygenase, PaaI subunit [Rhodobacterales bacterium HTCC2150] [Rhodobacteraceae bacterium HTCC2150]